MSENTCTPYTLALLSLDWVCEIRCVYEKNNDVTFLICIYYMFHFVWMCVSEFRSPSHISGLNRSASLNYTDRSESQSISGSNTQLNSSPSVQYIPDFNVRALTDLQIVKVRIDSSSSGPPILNDINNDSHSLKLVLSTRCGNKAILHSRQGCCT